jgi:hypothetical protein
MANQYKWLTWLQARQALAARLADPGMVFWVDAELKLYLSEALRVWNALTEVFNADFAFTATSAATWYSLATLTGSPRLRTLTDSVLYTQMEYMLLEPPTGGGAWTGTQQFALADLQGALQTARDEVIQASGCNLAQLPPLSSTPNVRRTVFADSTLEPRRARWKPDSGSPVTLSREDTLAFDAFETGHLQTPRTPSAWSVITGPPLAFDVDTAPTVPGAYDVISLQAGANLVPPAATLLNVPDDFAWVCRLGAMADLLSRDSEATDHQRAAYYRSRYEDGKKLMQAANWLLTATIGGVPVDTPSVREADGWMAEWEITTNAWPSLVTAGTDFCAPCPVATGSQSIGVSMILIGNAPVPVLDADFVQASRDTMDDILAYAQFLASQKMGGAEFQESLILEKQFIQSAAATNDRISKLGLFADVLRTEGLRQDRNQPR